MALVPGDLTRTTLTVLVVGVLLMATLYIVRPFLPALVWAITIVVATWPLLLRLQRLLWHSRALAVAVATVAILVVAVLPFWLATSVVIGRSDQLISLVQDATSLQVPPAPPWMRALPLVGENLAAAWDTVEGWGVRELAPRLSPYAGRAVQWFLSAVGGFGVLVVQFLLTVVIAAILHANGEAAARFVERFGRRLAGERGKEMVDLVGNAIRAVAVGVMVTSLVETAIGGAGLALVGVPLATVLTAVMFLFCLAQAGPGVVLIPAVVWMYAFRGAGAATALLAVTVVAITIDNVLRPFLIRKEADLPTLLVLTGVIGGLSTFGLVGVFVGPAVLAVSYTLLNAWMTLDEPAATASLH